MTDKKLTDKEIKKALEWLKSKTKEYCEQCAYKNSEVCDICIFSKIELALDYINRLEAENERLKSMNQAKLDMIHDLQTDLETAKAENEHLEAENKLLIDRNCELAEKGEKAIITLVKSQKETKAEAYKECVEKVKAHFKHRFYSVPDLSWLITLITSMPFAFNSFIIS